MRLWVASQPPQGLTRHWRMCAHTHRIHELDRLCGLRPRRLWAGRAESAGSKSSTYRWSGIPGVRN
ncbi:unannotated protein [freshwater metagenome]|uniref:Unannotated protein n=1 Tax=freshwater metagenome TaxID=449393 RepID=A0A6J7IJP2_9ZZZZ